MSEVQVSTTEGSARLVVDGFEIIVRAVTPPVQQPKEQLRDFLVMCANNAAVRAAIDQTIDEAPLSEGVVDSTFKALIALLES